MAETPKPKAESLFKGKKAAGERKPEPKTEAKAEPKSEAKAEPKKEEAAEPVSGRHARERDDLHKSHERERRDMHGNHRDEHRKMSERHQKAHAEMAARHATEAAPAAGCTGGVDEAVAGPGPNGADPAGAGQAAA